MDRFGILNCDYSNVADLSPLATCPKLRTLNVRQTKVTPASVAALQKALPDCKIDWDDPKAKLDASIDNSVSFNGHRYLMVLEPLGWEQAKAHAEKLGGHVAAIDSLEERNWIQQTLLPDFIKAGKHRFYIGGYCRTKDGPWEWVTGDRFDKSLWLGTGPDDGPKDDLVLTWFAQQTRWDDVGDTFGGLSYLIEWDDPAKATTPQPTASGTK